MKLLTENDKRPKMKFVLEKSKSHMLEHLNGIELITIDELQSMLNIDTEIAQIIMQELINNEIIIPIDILYEVKSNGKLLETCKKHLI